MAPFAKPIDRMRRPRPRGQSFSTFLCLETLLIRDRCGCETSCLPLVEARGASITSRNPWANREYPAKPALRLELLEWVAGALPAGQRVTECGLGDHLALVADDVVTLRRYLVGAETLVRTPDGAVYEVRQR